MTLIFLRLFIAVWASAFVALCLLVEAEPLIVVLNGIFLGGSIGLVAIYLPLAWRSLAVTSRHPDVRQFTVARLMWVTAVALSVGAAVYLRVAGAEVNSMMVTALSRWVAIGAMILEAYAPDAGLARSERATRRDRLVMNVSLAAGGVISVGVILAQRFAVLA